MNTSPNTHHLPGNVMTPMAIREHFTDLGLSPHGPESESAASRIAKAAPLEFRPCSCTSNRSVESPDVATLFAIVASAGDGQPESWHRRIRTSRLVRGMTIADAAHLMGVLPETYRALEGGRADQSAKHFPRHRRQAMGRTLGVSSAWLALGDPALGPSWLKPWVDAVEALHATCAWAWRQWLVHHDMPKDEWRTPHVLDERLATWIDRIRKVVSATPKADLAPMLDHLQYLPAFPHVYRAVSQGPEGHLHRALHRTVR